MTDEPSVLDYVKSRLRPGRYARVDLPDAPPDERQAPDGDNDAVPPASIAPAAIEQRAPVRWPWLPTAALLPALIGQAALAPGAGGGPAGIVLLVGGIILAILATVAGRERLQPPQAAAEDVDPATIEPLSLTLGLGLAILAFLITLQGKPPRFNPANLFLLAGSLYLVIRGLWVYDPSAPGWEARFRRLLERSRLFLSRGWTVTLGFPALAGAAAVAVVLFVRLYRLGEVPPEMNSDHAEKLLDILRVLNGEHLIFFPTNGGREALIFYLGALLHRMAGIALGFTLLKTGSVLIGLAALPFIYALGVELGGKRVGWLAFVLAGTAYWPNVVARFGLRLPFYMLFTAAVLYFIVRGLRSGRRNDFIWAGVWLGLGFYGYTPNRLLPLLVLTAFGLYLAHHRGRRGARNQLRFGLLGLLSVTLVALVLFTPLLAYIIVEPEAFLARTLTRLSDVEQPLGMAPLFTLADNTWRALRMFSWDAGEIWPVSIPHYPALGIAAGALFYLGAAIVAVRYALKRHWLDLLLLLSIPLLLLPSVLSLAFPAENPSLYRTGGVIVPVFLLAAVALDGLMRAVERGIEGISGRRAAWAVALAILTLAVAQESALVFGRYYRQYRDAAWNTSEIGRIAGDFANTIGSPDTIWVMGYPHWIDSRLAAANAGFPGRDYRMFPENLESTLEQAGAKMFFLHPNDIDGENALRKLYPQGWLSNYTSATPSKDFLIFFVPGGE